MIKVSFASSGLGFSDLFSKQLRGLLALSMLLAAVLLGSAVWAITHYLVPLIPDWSGRVGNVAEATASGAAILLSVVIALVTWPIVAMIVSGLFFDVAADRLEAKLLPEGQRGRPPSLASGLLAGLRFARVSVPLNLLAIPLYFIPVVNLVVAIGLNAFLLSRENYMLAGLRYDRFLQSHANMRSHRLSIFLAALPAAFVCIIPFVNFLVPLWALATMVRLRAAHHSPHIETATP